MTLPLQLTLITITFLVSSVRAQHEGHDMDWGMPDHSMGDHSMTPYLHFSVGDHVWFKEWVPKTKGAMFGACLGLFLLAIVERWLAATRAVANLWWRMRTAELLDYIHDQHATVEEKGKSPESTPPTSIRKFRTRFSAPFITLNEVSRGVLYAAQSLLMFAFMLVVMTYQGSFLISIVLGLGVGETLFGRFTNAHVGLYI
ncbi:copper transporter [Coprinopsis cinerea okayama7|uniref:Copper transport protein n=1 Tax=Coprinopsis cinerea (strain Okayama-7 / 130 / ATCC MYA-4618 / FGSC 9003) TaxID=240176 RepID=A8NKL8_COPC7|nr:copper transporter [Coprinopsis cinerea okayama7\|eukprot:XP_001834487.1 copper transporter [Coprinopsis cinerea okayama7\